MKIDLFWCQEKKSDVWVEASEEQTSNLEYLATKRVWHPTLSPLAAVPKRAPLSQQSLMVAFARVFINLFAMNALWLA